MPDVDAENPVHKRRWIAIAVAVVLPAALAVTFWRTTPTVGGWARYSAPDASKSAAVDYSQNGRLPVGAAASDPKSIYLQNCSTCHGANLEGGRIGPALQRADWPYKANRDMLVKVIHQGRGLTMPGFDSRLNNQQIESLVNWLQEQNVAKK